MSKASIDSFCSPRLSNSFTLSTLSTLSSENLDNLHKMVPMRNSYFTNCLPLHGNTYSRPIALSKLSHRQFKRTHKFEIIKNSPPKGLVFIWPQKRNFHYEREYTLVVRVLAQILYWLSEIGLFPAGSGSCTHLSSCTCVSMLFSGLPFKQPPWYIKPPIPKPENRDYIIEPDWNTVYF